MHKNDFFSLYIFFISLVFTQLPRTPNHFPLPRHWTRDRDFGLATATLDPRPRHWTRDRDIGPATRDPRPATISQTPLHPETPCMLFVYSLGMFGQTLMTIDCHGNGLTSQVA